MPVTHERHGTVSLVILDNPPVNALGQEMRQRLSEVLAEVEADPETTAVVLMGAGENFVAGADIAEFGKPRGEPKLPQLIERIENSAKCWTAALHGNALGGGFEVALGCHFRVATPDATIGLPEVSLGIMPGAGGTVRLPRLVRMDQAYDLITNAKRIGARKGAELGCVDLIVEGDLLTSALAFAADPARQRDKMRTVDRPVIGAPAGWSWDEEISRTRKRAGGQESPVVAALMLRDVETMDSLAALQAERQRFDELTMSAQSAALRHLFFAERAVAKPRVIAGVKPHDVKHVGVLGAGTMGVGIATALLTAGYGVTLVERDKATLERGLDQVRQNIAAAPRSVAYAAAPVASTEMHQLAGCDLIIEAVFEDMALKKVIFAELDKLTRPTAILASNTSYLSIDEIASAVRDPGRVIGLHFFAPAHVMKLIEVVRGRDSSPESIATGFSLARKLGKIAVLSGNCDGFIGNRVYAAYRDECVRMVETGTMPAEVDAAFRGFGFKMGPFEVQDLSSHEIALARRTRLRAAGQLGNMPHELPDRMCELGRIGRKVDKGWYDYRDGVAVPSPEVEAEIAALLRKRGIERESLATDEIMRRVLAVIRAEAESLLAEGIIDSLEQVDVVLTNGYGYPRWEAGPSLRAASSGPL